MARGETIPKATRQAIQSLRGQSTASELAELFQVSERSVVRIWSENATKELAKELRDGTARVNADLEQSGHHHAIYPEMVQMLTVKQYFHLMETREFYRAMRDAYPTNCAWGNLEEKYNRQINELLRVMGAWFGMERQKEPLTSTGVRNNDYTDLDYMEMAKVLGNKRHGKERQPSRAYARNKRTGRQIMPMEGLECRASEGAQILRAYVSMSFNSE